jgi:cephalosporin hydroxylase
MSEIKAMSLPVMADDRWQMYPGERFALEGLLSQVRPTLAIETGTAHGGSLRRLSEHAEEVHAFDIVPEVKDLEQSVPNATVHIGDSAVTLPAVLAGFAEAGREVDFAFIDGDHTAEGVQRDLQAVLDAPACAHTVVAIHDTANADVRRGLDAMGLADHPRVAFCMLDFVPGYLVVEDHPFSHQGWNGLGLLLLSEGPHAASDTILDRDHYSVDEIYRTFLAARAAPATPPATAPVVPAPPAPLPVAAQARGRRRALLRHGAIAGLSGALAGAATAISLRRR